MQDDKAVTGTRRAVLAAAGSVGAAAALSGCAANRTARATATTAARSAAPVGRVVGIADIPINGGKIYPDLDADGVVVTQPRAGEFKAFSATCTHRGCLLFAVSDGTINCPCHGARFSIVDGSVVQPGDGAPATGTFPLAPKNLVRAGDTLILS